MFQMEVDGTAEIEADYESSDYDSSRQQGPRHSIPFSDRLRGHNGAGRPVDPPQRPATHWGQQQFASQPQQLQDQQQQRAPPGRDFQSDELHRQAQSEALKRMLMFQADNMAPAQDPPNSQADSRHVRQVSAPVELPAKELDWSATHASSGTQANGHASQTSGHASQTNGYAPHGHLQNQRNDMSPNVLSMEADLKRMLKLS